MADLVLPHGARLLPLLVYDSELEESIKETETLSKVRLDSREVSDLIMLVMGAFSPLEGFVSNADYESVV